MRRRPGANATRATTNINKACSSACFLETVEKVLNYASKVPLSFCFGSSMAFPAVCSLLALPRPKMLYGVVNTKCPNWREGISELLRASSVGQIQPTLAVCKKCPCVDRTESNIGNVAGQV